MLAILRRNKLQRKVLLVIVAIILLPMLVTGIVSSVWITSRMDNTIAQRLRESMRLNTESLQDLHENARLFASILLEVSRGHLVLQAGRSPIPSNLQPLARRLGISLVQVYDADGKLIYTSRPAKLRISWNLAQDTTQVEGPGGKQPLLAAITLVPLQARQAQAYHLVLATLFDQGFLARLSRETGLATRLYYARNGDFANAFSDEHTSLKSILPAQAFAKLQNKQDYFSVRAEHGRYWGLYSPVVDTNGHIEAVLFSGQLRVGYSTLLTDQGLLTVTITLLGALLAIGTGLLLSRVVVRPLEYLHQGVLRLAAQDFRASIPINSQDELGELAQAFNAMANSLREARDQQRREFQRDKLTALGELSLAMAHEIRNPIGIIKTAVSLCETTEDERKQGELRRAIREESQRLDLLLNDFQQLARHHRPLFSLIDPAEPLEKALQVMLTGVDNITILRRYTHGVMVQADADLLYQAWVNLIRNALDAMGPQGGQLEVGSVMEANAVLLYLHDSGPGIPLEHMTRLFEPFYTTKAHGSGLGLTLSNTLAEANGARLEYIHGSWRGARFAMRFPLTQEKSN